LLLVAELNARCAAWLMGKGERPEGLARATGPLWMRDYSNARVGREACSALGDTLDLFGAKMMVVGYEWW